MSVPYLFLRSAACALMMFAGMTMLADAAADADSVVARVDFDGAHVLQKRVFGVHGELLWGAQRYGDQRLADLYSELGFTYIRFPGGTTANFYRWRSGDFGCDSDDRVDHKSKDRIKRFNQALSRDGRTYTSVDFASFIGQSRTQFSLVVNVLCSSPESTGQWMEELRNKGLDVRFVELGNELYYEEYAWRYPSVDEYMAAAQEHALAVKRVFPEAKVGVVASSSAFKSKEFPDLVEMAKRERDSRGLAFDRYAASASFGDAMAVHQYGAISVSRADMVLGTLDNETLYKSAISHFDERALSSLDYLAALNPKKEIWISEWGVAFYGELRKYQASFEESEYNALYVANALVSYFSNPVVTGANYHNLPALWVTVKNVTKPKPAALVANLFKEPVNQSLKVVPVMLQGQKEYEGVSPDYYSGRYPEVSGVFFDAGKTGYLIIVNKLSHPYLLKSISTEGVELAAQSFIRIDSNMLSDFARIDGSEIAIGRIGNGIQLPPYSVTRIRVGIERLAPQN